ncbi:MAG: TniQ family protein [Solirubrobacteraceae bacterium]
MRTLPLRLAPVDGESLAGYVARYSHTFGLQPGDLVRALGLDDGAGRVRAGRYGLSLTADQLHRAARASGISTDRLEAMLLSRFSGRAFTRAPAIAPVALARAAQAHEVLIWASRFCPHCLREHGAWLLRWQLGWSVVCVRHSVVLVRCCPKCGSGPLIGTRAQWSRDQAGELSDPSSCSRRHGRELCRASLTAASAVSVAGDTALLAAQQRIDALLDGDLRPTLAGEQLEPPAYLSDLRTLAKLLNRHDHLSANRSEARSGPLARASGNGARLLDDPGALAAVLPEALRLADLPDRATLAQALRELADLGYRADGQTLRPGPLNQMSAPLRDALQKAASETVYATASTRMGFDPRAFRRPDDLDQRLRAWHVPQLFWAQDYARELNALFDFDGSSTWLGRRFCSVLLARMLKPLDWRAAVRYLDLPAHFLNDGYNTMFVKLRNANRFEELARRIKRLANERAQHDLIDYKQRRATLADWTGIDPRTWQLLQPHPRPQTWRADPPARRTHASVWLWCELTSGHEHAAPVTLPTRKLATQTHFARKYLAPLRERLLLLGELLLSTPADARQAITTRLAVALHERGSVAETFYLDIVDPLTKSRILAHTSAHTGVDIATITTAPQGSYAPPAIKHARVLAAALLRETALASWAAVASTIGGTAQRAADGGREYHAALTRSPALVAELNQLVRAVEDWRTPVPTAPTTPHRERMHSLAAAIRAHTVELFPPPHARNLAARTSMAVCHTHTDLTWDDIADIHDTPAGLPAYSRTTVSHHRRTDPEFEHRYQQLLDQADELQREAGFANARLERGMTSKQTPENAELEATGNSMSHSQVA